MMSKISSAPASAKLSFINAAGKYGKRAQKHLGKLKQVKDDEKDPATKEAAALVIERIEGDSK